MKKWTTKIGAGALAMMFACSLAACSPSGSADTDYGYMTLDINPSVEFIIEDGIVVDVAADNTDGEILLAGELLEGKTVEEATEIVVDLAEAMGYLTTENNRVKIVVVAETDQMQSSIEAKASAGAAKASLLAEINHEPRSKDKRKEKSLNDDKLSAAKIRLITELMEYDDSITYEIAAEMSVEELVKALKEFRVQFEGIDGDELKTRFEKAKEEMKLQLQEDINEIMGETYAKLQSAADALEGVYESLETAMENVTIASEDVQNILTLLNLTDEDLSKISVDGVVTVESVDDYMDKYFESVDANGETVEEAIEEILNKYEELEDTYVLTQDDYQALVDAWGDNQPALPAYENLTLEDVEAFVEDVEERVETMFEEVKLRLNDIQKEAMKMLEDGFDRLEKTVHYQLQNEIQQYKNGYLNQKEQRLPEDF